MRTSPPSEEQLCAVLDPLVAAVANLVRDQAISAPAGSILARALEKTRTRGSQAVFAAFILDVAAQRAVLYQLGDIVCRVRVARGWQGQASDATGRWSSAAFSLRGLSRQEFSEVTGLLLHSDGLRSAWILKFEQAAADRHSFAEEADLAAVLDDVSFVAAVIDGSRAATEVRADGESAASGESAAGEEPESTLERRSDPPEETTEPEMPACRSESIAEPGRPRWRIRRPPRWAFYLLALLALLGLAGVAFMTKTVASNLTR
jgi:hypothetical protein